jgi:PAS domain S-box-containing protein
LKATTGVVSQGEPAARVHPLPRAWGKGVPNKSNLLAIAESIGNMGHWHWQRGSDAIAWSEQVYTIAGIDPAAFTPNYPVAFKIYHPDDRDKAREQVDNAFAAATTFEFDARVLRPDGEIRRVIVRGEPECVDGEPVAVFGVMTDVTEAFAAISSIQDQHEMLDLAAELAQLGHWVWAVDRSMISFCSDNLARIHGTSVSALLGRFTHPEHFSNALVISHRERYRTTVAAALSKGEPYSIEYRLSTLDGAQKEIREIGHPLFDHDGRLTRFIGTVQDITEAKRRENELRRAKVTLETQAEALRRSETKFRDIVEGSIQGILVLRDFKPVFANEAYARMLGLPGPEEVIALGDLRRVMMTDSLDNDAYWRMAMEGRLDGATHRAGLRTIDGRIVWIDAIGRMIEWEGEASFLLTVIDVTERHIAEQELLHKTKQLQELNLQKDKLFSIIGHDLKGPFNSVIGFSDLLASRAEHLTPAKVADYARLVRDSAISVHGLFDNLLTWAAFQIRDSAPRFVAVDLAQAVTDCIEPLRAMAAEKGVFLANAINESAAGVHVLADEDLLRIVIRNLVSNGIKFSHPGGTVSIAATVAPLVRISVQDSGVGMKSADVANLFRLDKNVSLPGTRGEKGTGLGLYLCHDIVTRHGGSITADSKPGEGCRFDVLLPRAYPQDDV